MSNRIQLRRTATPGNVPTLAQLLTGEMAINLADGDLFISTGSEVLHVNKTTSIKTTPGARFISDAQLALLDNVASASVLGHVKVGSNIAVDANGVISLAVASNTLSGVLSATDWTTFNGKQDALGYVPVNKAGDTMTGALVLSGAPTLSNHASTKQYTDDALGTTVLKTGSTMTGLLVLSDDPAQNLGAATKQYVDNAVNDITGKYAAPVQTLLLLAAIAHTTIIDKQMRLVENTGCIFRFDVQSNDVADGIDVVQPTDIASGPGRWIKVQAATQNHELLNGLLGGAANDHLHITTAEKNGYDNHISDSTLHLTSGQHTWIGNINASATEVNYLINVTGNVQNQLNSKQATIGYTPLNVAGDTMTGALVLNADPTIAMHAATMQYVLGFTVDGGTW